MKKVACSVLAFLLVVSFALPCFAVEPEDVIVSHTIQQLGTDSYIIITLRKSVPTPIARSGIYTQTGSKDYTYVSSGTLQWTFSVAGNFEINPGVSCKCTNSAYRFSRSVSGWSLSSADSSHSGSTATAWGTVTGPKPVSPRVSVSCDSNGNLT